MTIFLNRWIWPVDGVTSGRVWRQPANHAPSLSPHITKAVFIINDPPPANPPGFIPSPGD